MPDMDTMEEPIDPLVAQGLGLKFYQPDMRFRWFDQRWTLPSTSPAIDYDTSW